jgi:hypothetical protein
MQNLVSNIQKKLSGNSFDTNSDTTLPSNDFRKIQIPQIKIGLGSTEGDLIAMAKKYFEIVGLVLFVWILGKIGSPTYKKYSRIFFFLRLFSLQCFMDFTCCINIFISSTPTNTI